MKELLTARTMDSKLRGERGERLERGERERRRHRIGDITRKRERMYNSSK